MDDQGPGGRDRGRGAKPLPRETGEGLEDDGEPSHDQDKACPAEDARAVTRRQRPPAGDQSGHQAGDHAQSEDEEGEAADRRLDPTRHSSSRSGTDGGPLPVG